MNGKHLIAIGMIFALGGFAGCSDDDGGTGPGGGGNLVPWPEVELPSVLVDGLMLSLDTAGDRTVGLAVGSSGAWVIERGPTGWETTGDTPLPGTVPAPRAQIPALPLFASCLAVDGHGNVQVVGAEPTAPAPVVWSEGDLGWQVTNMSGTELRGALNSVVATGAQDIVGAGAGVSGFLVVTGSVYDGLDFGFVSTPGEALLKSVLDLSESSGAVYGLGFDNGADGSLEQPKRFVVEYSEGAWTMLPSPCGSCSTKDFRAIAATPWSVYVGGASTDFSQGAEDESVAWLMEYSISSGEWTELVVPSAGELDRVNDILVSSSGDLYLACGERGASIVRMLVDGGAVVEWEDAGMALFSLGESADGVLLAAGLIEGIEKGTPVILERE